jgi:hypothetical protein
MLYQDTLTGMLHEVPDSQVNGWGLAEDPYGVGEAQMVYDGLGNPLGWGFLKRLVKKAVPFATSMLGPYGQIINKALPVVTRALAEAPPQIEGLPVTYPRPAAFSPTPMSRPFPGGWRQPGAMPGPQPRRLYLRCSSWRGPSGLVPGNAAPGPVAPGAPIVPVAAPVGIRPGYRGRGRGRRR